MSRFMLEEAKMQLKTDWSHNHNFITSELICLPIFHFDGMEGNNSEAALQYLRKLAKNNVRNDL